jgi:hypothetical protein
MLQTLTDFTGYLTTQTYILPSGGFSGYGVTGYTTTSALATPQQEEIRKDIRALKGLVLSRYGSSAVYVVLSPLTCLMLQADFRHPKGFIHHKHAPTMICDTLLQSIDEVFFERELPERPATAFAGVSSFPHLAAC